VALAGQEAAPGPRNRRRYPSGPRLDEREACIAIDYEYRRFHGLPSRRKLVAIDGLGDDAIVVFKRQSNLGNSVPARTAAEALQRLGGHANSPHELHQHSFRLAVIGEVRHLRMLLPCIGRGLGRIDRWLVHQDACDLVGQRYSCFQGQDRPRRHAKEPCFSTRCLDQRSDVLDFTRHCIWRSIGRFTATAAIIIDDGEAVRQVIGHGRGGLVDRPILRGPGYQYDGRTLTPVIIVPSPDVTVGMCASCCRCICDGRAGEFSTTTPGIQQVKAWRAARCSGQPRCPCAWRRHDEASAFGVGTKPLNGGKGVGCRRPVCYLNGSYRPFSAPKADGPLPAPKTPALFRSKRCGLLGTP